MTYAEAMRRYGSDKPDTRFAMELVDLSPHLKDTEFSLYQEVLAAGGEVKAINAGGCGNYSRKDLDSLTEVAKRYGAGGMAYIKINSVGEVSSSLAKALGDEKVTELAAVANCKAGDALLIVAGKPSVVAASLNALRSEVAQRQGLIDPNRFCFLWVTDFPMFEYHEEDGRYYAMHHPFTSPVDDDLSLLERGVEGGEKDLLAQIRTKAYDPVINGVEMASGSIRIHRRDVQRLVFKALGMTTEEARERFGF